MLVERNGKYYIRQVFKSEAKPCFKIRSSVLRMIAKLAYCSLYLTLECVLELQDLKVFVFFSL